MSDMKCMVECFQSLSTETKSPYFILKLAEKDSLDCLMKANVDFALMTSREGVRKGGVMGTPDLPPGFFRPS